MVLPVIACCDKEESLWNYDRPTGVITSLLVNSGGEAGSSAFPRILVSVILTYDELERDCPAYEEGSAPTPARL